MSDPNPPIPPPVDNAINAEDRQWAMIGHLSPLIGLVIPLGNVLAPLIVWQIKKDTLPFAAEQSKEALNFQITVLLALIVSGLLTIVLIGLLLLPVVAIGAIVLSIMAGLKANEGIPYRYPFTLRLVN